MTRTAHTTPIWLRALNWLADRDAAYRETQKLKDMPAERLEDMGISQEDARRGGVVARPVRGPRTAPKLARG